MQGSEKNSDKNKPTSPAGDDDNDVWSRVTKSTRKLNKKQKASYQAERLSKPARAGVKKPVSTNISASKQPLKKPDLKLETVGPATPRPVKKLEKLDRNELRRVRRGRDAIEQTLDLHGLRAEIAQKRVDTFIRSADINGCKWVLIITGKGEQGAGTLKKQTPIWLGILAEQGLVMGFDLAPQNMGGSGAVCVRLRKKKT